MPETVEDLYHYLASGAVKGIRESTALKIVDRFGEKTFDILQYEPERLAEIKAHNDMVNAKIAEAEQALKAQNAIYAANAGKIFGSGAKLKKAAKAEIAKLESTIANLKRTLR